MSKTKKSRAKPEDRAEPTLKQATNTDAEKVNVAYATAASMAKSPLWPTATDVQSAAKAWTVSADDLGANAKIIADLRNQLKAAEAKQLQLRRKYRSCRKQVLSSVAVVCAGSASDVTGFSLDVITRTAAKPLDAMTGITTQPGANIGDATAKWLRGLARHGFIVQHATDTANAATYSPAIPCTHVTYTVKNAGASGSTVYLRVAAVDPTSPTGMSPWSAWIAATVR